MQSRLLLKAATFQKPPGVANSPPTPFFSFTEFLLVTSYPFSNSLRDSCIGESSWGWALRGQVLMTQALCSLLAAMIIHILNQST